MHPFKKLAAACVAGASLACAAPAWSAYPDAPALILQAATVATLLKWICLAGSIVAVARCFRQRGAP